MNLSHQKVSITGLLLAVTFLALMPLSPASTVLATAASAQSSSHSYSRHSSWNPSYTYSHRSGSWSWSRTWSMTWSRTWSRRTHSYPTYTSTEYVPAPIPACDPNNPFSSCYSPPPCNPYDPLSSCYVPPTTIPSYSPPTQTIVVTESSLQTVIVTQPLSTTAQGPDFALSISPSTVSLPPGNFVGSTDFTLTLTSIQEWRDGIDFTTSPLPSGITFSNLPSQFSFSSSTAGWVVHVNIGPSAQPGNYAILIIASSGSLIHSASVIVEVAG